MRPALGIGILLLVAGLATAGAQIIKDQFYVHTIYLSPSDKAYNAAYEAELTNAVFKLQDWFSDELSGVTFKLSPDPVQWFQTSHNSAWYDTNPASPAFSDGRFWTSALADGFSLTGGQFYDSNDIWLYYLDADQLAGQYMGGAPSVALFPANDLRGLNGQVLVPVDPGDSSFNPGFNRWVGGMGHELGHAFGLDHPASSPGGPDDYALMYWGYLTYPDTYLTAADRQKLLGSRFFAVPEPGTASLVLLSLAMVGVPWWRVRRRASSIISTAHGL